MRHINIPVFIPHLGCPNQCVFCNQRSISGVDKFDPCSVTEIIDNALSTTDPDDEIEIAFFGGSFTGIDRDLMISLLEISKRYIDGGSIRSVRCSTRPDYIDDEILDLLKKYGVKTIELGLQSSSDKVLEISKRGHNFEAEKIACKKIVDNGFNLVGQMMIGLPGSNIKYELETADFIISAGAIGARIYPTVVFRDTELAFLTETGKYAPLTLDDAIKRSALVLERFIDSKIEVIRIGLQSSENLSDKNQYVGGPNHPALGELVIGEFYYNKITKLLVDLELSQDDTIKICVSRGAISKAVGQNKRNKIRLAEKYKNISFVEKDELSEFEILVETDNGENKCI